MDSNRRLLCSRHVAGHIGDNHLAVDETLHYYQAAGFKKRPIVATGDAVPFVPSTPLLTLALVHAPVIGSLFEFLVSDDYAPTGEGLFITGDGSLIRHSESKIRYGAAIGRPFVAPKRFPLSPVPRDHRRPWDLVRLRIHAGHLRRHGVRQLRFPTH